MLNPIVPGNGAKNLLSRKCTVVQVVKISFPRGLWIYPLINLVSICLRDKNWVIDKVKKATKQIKIEF